MRISALAILLVLALAGQSRAFDAPMELAGFRLGADIKEYPGRIDTGASVTDLDRRYLTTMALKPIPGFRSGYVTYGNCAEHGRIARIKMNYEDHSLTFYEKVLAAMKKRFGEPREWRGNPFGTLRIWKWSIKDKELGDISIILQRYTGEDDSFTKGNSIRIAASALLNEEAECWREKHPEEKLTKPAPPVPLPPFDSYLPH